MKASSRPTTPRAVRSPKAPRESQNGDREPAPQIPKRWRWHYETLSRLLDRQLSERSQHLKEAASPIERYSMHQADSASDEFDQELALSQLSAEQDALYEMESAMERITNGTYGVCEETGAPIPDERLKAIPWTRFCKEAKERIERISNGSRPHLGTLRSLRSELDTHLAESGAAMEDRAPVAEAPEN